jgi:Leucine-rich repeat (LRR) protein
MPYIKRPTNYKTITELKISEKKITKLPSWLSKCEKLIKLDCSHNNIKQLNNLPKRLKILNFSYNKIIKIDNLSQTLKYLNCSNNIIVQLDNLPPTLNTLQCEFNQIIILSWKNSTN